MKDTQSIFTAMLESKSKKSNKKPVKESKSVEYNNGFTGRLLRESVDEDVMDDVLDNIQVVTDPDKTVDELEARADEIQKMIEDSPESEAAFSDEYVGKKVFACPVCGESFFADDSYQEGDVCPICNAESVDGFLLQGEVKAVEDEPEITETPTEVETEPEPESQEAIDNEEDTDEKTEDFENESIDKMRKEAAARRRAAARRIREAKAKKLKKECAEAPEIEVTINAAPTTVEEPKSLDYEVDEESFDSALDEFANENYGEAIKRIKTEKVGYDPKSDTLNLYCKAECKNGKTSGLKFELTEVSNRGNHSIMKAVEKNDVFKVESKKPAFEFRVVRCGKTIKCEGMRYNFITTHSKVGKVKVEGYTRGLKKKELIEAFDSSMPSWVKKFMKGKTSWRYTNSPSRAGVERQFDPSSAVFVDMTNASEKELRSALRDGDVIFMNTTTLGPIKVVYAPNSGNENKLQITSNDGKEHKYDSFKSLMNASSQIVATPYNDAVAQLRKDRANSREDIISREGDSAQSSSARRDRDGENWVKDASGYWHDLNKYVKKLVSMHENDAAYIVNKASKTFMDMAQKYADAIVSMSKMPDIDFRTFADDGFDSVSRRGQRLLSRVGEAMDVIKDESPILTWTFDEYSNKWKEHHPDTEASEDDYEGAKKYALHKIQTKLSEINSYNKELDSILASI